MLLGLGVSGLVAHSGKTVNYLAAYAYTIMTAYLIMKSAFYEATDYRKLLSVNTVAVIFIAFFALFEFFAKFLMGFTIQEYIPRFRPTLATIDLFTLGRVSRSYALASEPTILAQYFTTLGTLAVWHILRRVKRRLLRCAGLLVIFLGALTTFSAAGIVSILMAGMISFICSVIMQNNKARKLVVTVTIGTSLALLLITIKPAPNVLDLLRQSSLYKKITLVNGGRLDAWTEGVERITANPFFGSGLGSTSSEGKVSNLNWYLFIWAEGGMVSLFPLLAFLVFTFLRILFSEIEGRFWFLASFLSACIHFLAVSTFFHPFLWTALLIFSTYYAQSDPQECIFFPSYNRALIHASSKLRG
jgi:O-antigen ligase